MFPRRLHARSSLPRCNFLPTELKIFGDTKFLTFRWRLGRNYSGAMRSGNFSPRLYICTVYGWNSVNGNTSDVMCERYSKWSVVNSAPLGNQILEVALLSYRFVSFFYNITQILAYYSFFCILTYFQFQIL